MPPGAGAGQAAQPGWVNNHNNNNNNNDNHNNNDSNTNNNENSNNHHHYHHHHKNCKTKHIVIAIYDIICHNIIV